MSGLHMFPKNPGSTLRYRLQKAEKKQVQYWGTTNFRRLLRHAIRPGDLAARICSTVCYAVYFYSLELKCLWGRLFLLPLIIKCSRGSSHVFHSTKLVTGPQAAVRILCPHLSLHVGFMAFINKFVVLRNPNITQPTISLLYTIIIHLLI